MFSNFRIYQNLTSTSTNHQIFFKINFILFFILKSWNLNGFSVDGVHEADSSVWIRKEDFVIRDPRSVEPFRVVPVVRDVPERHATVRVDRSRKTWNHFLKIENNFFLFFCFLMSIPPTHIKSWLINNLNKCFVLYFIDN